MEYSFDIEHAKQYGVNEAIMIKNLWFWIKKNKANEKHFHDGRTWTFNSKRAWAELYPFWTERQMRIILESLIKQGVLVTGRYNKIGFDRTLWYAFKDESIMLNSPVHWTKQSSTLDENVQPIPDTLPDTLPDTYIAIDEIVNFWNSFNIVRHDISVLKKQKDKVDKIKKVISIHGIEKVKKTISNYAHIVSNSDKYYFNHKWSLWDFCKRGFDKFTPESHADQNFKHKRRA